VLKVRPISGMKKNPNKNVAAIPPRVDIEYIVPTEFPTSFTSLEINRMISGETIPKQTNGGNTKHILVITIPSLRLSPNVADMTIDEVKGMIKTNTAEANTI
jgi:hypothetical protein